MYPSFDLFGYKVTPMNAAEQLDLLTHRMEARENCVISPLNTHGLHVMLNPSSVMRKVHAKPSTYVVIDGMPIVPLCRLAGIDASREDRVTWLDLIFPLLKIVADRGWNVYYVGSREEILEPAMRVVRERVPNLNIKVHHGFAGMQNQDVIDDIVAFRPHLIMVGMGAEVQETWIHLNNEAIGPASLICVGALFEYLAGAAKTPPRWMGEVGLEWFFRLQDDPKRFWRRYLVEPIVVAVAILRHLTTKQTGTLGPRTS